MSNEGTRNNAHWTSCRVFREPAWWSVIISVIQVFVIGGVGFYINHNNEARIRHQEIHSLRLRLEENDPIVYRPVTDLLIARESEGRKEIIDYVNNAHCAPWHKAQFLYSRILAFSQAAEEKTNAAKMLWRTWLCYRPYTADRLEPSLQLYELLKNDPELMCATVLNDLKTIQRAGGFSVTLIEQAALLVALTKPCAPRSSPDLEGLQSRFFKNLQERSNPAPDEDPIYVMAFLYDPWIATRPAIDDRFEASESTWVEVVNEITLTFSRAGTAGSTILWDDLKYEALPTRLVLGHRAVLMLEGSPLESEARARLDKWVALGLKARDRESRYAAVSLIGNLKFKGHEDSLRNLAESDEEPIVRGKARRILTALAID
jgi:hypothetical protein